VGRHRDPAQEPDEVTTLLDELERDLMVTLVAVTRARHGGAYPWDDYRPPREIDDPGPHD
jgi:hypothetical protein